MKTMVRIITSISVICGPLWVSAQSLPGRIDSTIQVEISGKEADSSDVVSGIVMLTAEILASGKVGRVVVLTAEPEDVGKRAVADIRSRQFKPEERNGVPVDVVKTILCVFSITYDEDSPALKQKALITSQPSPNFLTISTEGFKGEKVTVSATLAPTGNVVLGQGTESDLPPSIIKVVRDAVRQIKFKPALHKSGRKVAQAIKVTHEIR